LVTRQSHSGAEQRQQGCGRLHRDPASAAFFVLAGIERRCGRQDRGGDDPP
jgi:hypothetical protein